MNRASLDLTFNYIGYPAKPNSHVTYKNPPHEKIIEEENNHGLINI